MAGVEAADAALTTSERDPDDTESLHSAGRSRARTLTRTYSNLSQSMIREVSYAELDEKKTGQRNYYYHSFIEITIYRPPLASLNRSCLTFGIVLLLELPLTLH